MLYYYARYNSSSVHLNYTLFKFILVLYTIYFIVNSYYYIFIYFFFSSRRRHTRWPRDWSSDCALPISLLLYGQAIFHEHLGSYEQAVVAAMKSMEQDRARADVWGLLGSLYAHQGQAEEAEKAFRSEERRVGREWRGRRGRERGGRKRGK